ncbi:MAG: carbon storage regulator [Thermoguttaceae bacterium]
MLVLTRKVGQQVVVPECGGTIGVVGLNNKQVRLGITAPSATQVHRNEVWQRICQDGVPLEQDGQRAGQGLQGHDQTPGPRDHQALAFGGNDAAIARLIAQRLGGRVGVVTVQTIEGRVVVSGFVNSYYLRQLLQAAVREVVGTTSLAAPTEVEYDIDVVQYRTTETFSGKPPPRDGAGGRRGSVPE